MQFHACKCSFCCRCTMEVVRMVAKFFGSIVASSGLKFGLTGASWGFLEEVCELECDPAPCFPRFVLCELCRAYCRGECPWWSRPPSAPATGSEFVDEPALLVIPVPWL